MIKIDVLIQEKFIINPEQYLKSKTKKIKRLLPLIKNKKVTFSLLLTGNQNIKNLNRKYRNKNKTTDVLSFPFYQKRELRQKIKEKKDTYLGDIVLNYYKIRKLKKKDFINKFNKLWVHGLLHLLGYRHKKNKEFFKMQKLEDKIFKKIKI